MTGIFGYYNKIIDHESILLLLKSLNHNITETKSFPSCLLAKLDVSSKTKQEKILETVDEISIISYGEIYNENISNFQETLLNLYKNNNLKNLKKLNGSFIAVFFDNKTEKITLINDRYGTIPLYYTYNQKHFYFSPKIHLLLKLGAKKVIQKDAVLDFLIFGFLLGNKTFFNDIHKLPPASILEYSKGELKHFQYWNYQIDSKKYNTKSIEQLTHDLGKLWEKSVERRIKKGKKIIIPLSGGLDSRAILAAALKHTSKENIITYSYGEKESFDFKIAQIIAQKTGVKHVSLGVEKRDFNNLYSTSFNDSEGMIDATPYCPMIGYQKLKTFGNTFLTGFMGGEIMGSLISPKMMKKRLKPKQDYIHAKKFIFKWRKRFDYKLIMKLCAPLLLELNNYYQYFHHTLGNIHTINNEDFINICTLWLYQHEERNYTSNCVLRFRNHFEYTIPFLDNDLVDFMLSIPPKFKMHKFLFKRMLLQKYPELFTLPTKTNYGHGLNTNDALLQASRIYLFLKSKINLVSNNLRQRNTFFDKRTNYIDYNELLRTNNEYREFVNHYINKVKKREYFNSAFVEHLWKLETHGKKNYAMLLGLLVTFELFLEQYVDQ